MNSEAIRKHIRALLQEKYGDLSYWSDFDRNEFNGDAMRAAMDDMKADGIDNVTPLGKNQYEGDMDIDQMISDLENARLGLPNDSKKLMAIQKQLNHLKRMGAGSLNESINETELNKESLENEILNFVNGDGKIPTIRGILNKFSDNSNNQVLDALENLKKAGKIHVNGDLRYRDRINYVIYGDKLVSKPFEETQLDEYMSPEAFSTSKYNQILADKQVDLYYNRIADDLAHGKDTKNIVRALVRLNGGKLPPTVQSLFDNAQNIHEIIGGQKTFDANANDIEKLMDKNKIYTDADFLNIINQWGVIKPNSMNAIVLGLKKSLERMGYKFTNKTNQQPSRKRTGYDVAKATSTRRDNFDNAQNMFENEDINPDAVDTTNLYRFLKDAIHQMVKKGLSEEKIALTLETILNKHFTIAKKGKFNMNEQPLEEYSNSEDYEIYANETEPFLRKDINYTYNDFAKAFAKTGNAVLHSRNMNAIIDILNSRGYRIEEYVGEGASISTTIKKGTNAKPDGPAHTILSQEGNGISKVIQKGTNVKPTIKQVGKK